MMILGPICLIILCSNIGNNVSFSIKERQEAAQKRRDHVLQQQLEHRKSVRDHLENIRITTAKTDERIERRIKELHKQEALREKFN